MIHMEQEFAMVTSFCVVFLKRDGMKEMTMDLKHPNKVRVIVENQTKRNKYLVPKSLLVCYFLHIVKSKLRLNKNETILLFSKNQLLLPTDTVGNVHSKYKTGNILYCSYQKENVFG